MKGSGFEVAIVRTGEVCVELTQELPVIVERSWGRRVLDLASHLLWRA